MKPDISQNDFHSIQFQQIQNEVIAKYQLEHMQIKTQ